MAIRRIICSECGARLKVSSDDLGTEIECPKCGKFITLSGETAEPVEVAEPAPAELAPRIKAPWEYAQEWARVRFALLICTIAGALTLIELATGEITDFFYRRAYSSLELYLGLAAGLLIGGLRIYGKVGFRHVPRQWGPRTLLWVCVGVEVALMITIASTTIVLARTPPPAEKDGPDIPAELKKVLTPKQQDELRKEMRKQHDLVAGTPVQRDPYVRVVSVGFGLAVLLAGLISILWPIYLKELAGSIKDQDAWDIGDRVLDILGPAFMIWVIGSSIYQFMASVTEVSGLYRPPGKSVTVLGLLTIQILLIRVYWGLRKSLRAKARLKKPKAKSKT